MRRLAGVIVIVLAFLIAIVIFTGDKFVTDKYFCGSDADCAAEQCCHPTSAINRNFAPSCSEAVCTMECRSGTIDCGQGEIKCIKNQCLAAMK